MFLKEKQEFEKSFEIMEGMLKYKERLPKQIFKSPLDFFLICEIENAMGGPFENALKELAATSRDDYIIMGILDPDPVTYYYKEFGYYNWIHLPANMNEDYYWDMLNVEPKESPADTLVDNSYIMAWASPTNQWAIWGERDYGIAILGVNKKSIMRKRIPENEIWMEMGDDVAEIISLNFKKFILPQEIKETLFLHYQNKD
ncbi:hypothetical protein [Paenibacillus popilliae]|uniref:FOG: TPR repeat n=1 Tax=Paenibacillus popilliae ATCC 14706 TaxID=1212764 RepID=M9L9T6_PAEPP|nr:hypothetical protein [Paenibacillus popilliae]GAC42257.1 FOG: TPR repeat [Paenibacillus popilliae ATCC 14706]